jgi:predicted dinucleotide-binding enzyme
MKIAVLGSGTVGEVLADGFRKHGHDVVRGSRDPSKLAAWAQQSGGRTATFADASADADVVVLAVKGSAAGEALRLAGDLTGKVIIDATNPIAAAPPVNGVLQYFTGPNESLMERLQALAPAANFVKAFSSVGNPMMINPEYAGGRPTMFICGNNATPRAPPPGSSISSAGRPPTWARSTAAARSSRCASCGASSACAAAAGATRSSCCAGSRAPATRRRRQRGRRRAWPRPRRRTPSTP